MELKYINNSNTCMMNERNGVSFVTFPKLAEQKDIVHGFSTRLGGVSKNHLSSMNLSFSRGDEKENVLENHKRFAKVIGYDEKKLVFSDQVHTTKIHKVGKEDAGKGIVTESDIKEIDGLVTNIPGIPLITFYADCVPLYFYDPVKKVVALAHSGWRGTIEEIGGKMVSFMEKEYGSKAADMICAIAPSICQSCYEVSSDVALQFKEKYSVYYENKDMTELLYKKENGKYQLNLHKACELTLLHAGILKEHLDITDLCTCCNPDIFFSHRASMGKRGNLAAVIMLQI
ncbi:MAG: peptidoglycan editing factor PgeF [Lachnospiraceae bacterium]